MMTLTRKLVKILLRKQILAVADQVVVSGATFLATIAVGRWAGASQLGAYSLGMSALFATVGAQEALIMIPYTVRRNKPGGDTPTRAGQSLAQSALLSSVLTSSFLILALLSLFSYSHERLTALLAALAFLTPFLMLREFARQYCFSHLRVEQAVAMDSSALALQAASFLWLGISGSISATAVCVANGVAFAAVSIGWLYRNHTWFKISGIRPQDVVRNDWSLGGWLLAAQITVSIQASAAPWLTAAIDGTAAAGVYSACVALVSLANPIIMGFVNILLPRTAIVLSREGAAGLRSHLIRDAALLGTVMAGFCGFLSVASEPLAHLLLRGRAFIGHQHVVQILALAWLVTAVGAPASNALASLEKPRRIFWVSLAGASTNILTGLWLTSHWGLIGAAYGFLAGSLVGAVGRWIAFLLTDPSRHAPRTAAEEVLRQLKGPKHTHQWTTTSLGEGIEAWVFAARWAGCVPSHDSPAVVIKIYKRMIAQEQAEEQFRALRDMHCALNGHNVAGWNIAVPLPLYLSRNPLALVMTMVPGRSLLQHLEYGGDETLKHMDSIARAVVSGINTWWQLRHVHGDLNFDNILCDLETRTLAFLDAGSPMACAAEAHGQWLSPSRDLGYLLYEAVITIRRSIRRIGAATRKQIFAKEILRVALRTLPSVIERWRLLDEVQLCAQSHLMTLDRSVTPRGLWCSILRVVGRYRIASLLGALRTELGDTQMLDRT